MVNIIANGTHHHPIPCGGVIYIYIIISCAALSPVLPLVFPLALPIALGVTECGTVCVTDCVTDCITDCVPTVLLLVLSIALPIVLPLVLSTSVLPIVLPIFRHGTGGLFYPQYVANVANYSKRPVAKSEKHEKNEKAAAILSTRFYATRMVEFSSGDSRRRKRVGC